MRGSRRADPRLERAAQIYIDLKQSARDGELRGTGLSHCTAATRVNERS